MSAAGVRRLPRALEAHLAVRGDAVRGAGVAWTPSLTVRRDGPVTVVARAARAFRVPTFFDLYLASPQRIIARPLAPERVSHDLELRALTRHGRRGMNLRAELSVFDRRTRDAIVWFPGNVGWSPTNVPVERARGAEVQGSAERHGLEASLWGGVYGTRLWDGFMEMRTPYVPYRSGGASLSARRGRLTLASEMRLVGRRPFVNGPSHPDLELPGAALANASLAYRVRVRGAALSLHLSGDNLGGARWESVRRYPTPGRTFAAGITLEP